MSLKACSKRLQSTMLCAISRATLLNVIASRVPRSLPTWLPPDQGCFTVNYDGSRRVEDGLAAHGGRSGIQLVIGFSIMLKL
ncbi:hypothetical protein V6N13_108095 [Hibiscus sabdariffa]